jgi:hypothetical protein
LYSGCPVIGNCISNNIPLSSYTVSEQFLSQLLNDASTSQDQKNLPHVPESLLPKPRLQKKPLLRKTFQKDASEKQSYLQKENIRVV